MLDGFVMAASGDGVISKPVPAILAVAIFIYSPPLLVNFKAGLKLMASVTYRGPLLVEPSTTLNAFVELSPQDVTFWLSVVVLVEALPFNQSDKLLGTFPGVVEITTAVAGISISCANAAMVLNTKTTSKRNNFAIVGLPKFLIVFIIVVLNDVSHH